MNRFQKAVAATAIPGTTDPINQALCAALAELPDNEDGFEQAKRAAEAVVESAVKGLFALRDLQHASSVDQSELVESIDCPLIREYVVYEVLADSEPPDYGIEELAYLTTEGPFIGDFGHVFRHRVDVSEMATALTAAGSEPEFFDLYGDPED